MIEGSLVALVTPMDASGAIDWNALEALIEFQIAGNISGIVSVGTTGESATLDFNEHEAVIKRTVEVVNKRVPVIAGSGANSTQEAIHLTRSAYNSGADAALLVTPYYNKPIQEGLYHHYRTLAESVPMPQILYNVPGRTCVDLLPETVTRLSQISNIIGLKEATSFPDRVPFLRQACGEDFLLYSGEDAYTFEHLKQGANGMISVTANIYPSKLRELYDAVLDSALEKAQSIDEFLQPLHDQMFTETNPTPVKYALHCMEMIDSGIRLPLLPLSESKRKALKDCLKVKGLIK